MKFVTILCDGMSDYPLPQLGGKTPMEKAHKPHMDALCQHAMLGLAKTVPDGMKPGSDVANLSVMGYDPRLYYTGRSPLEALSIGIDLKANDLALRCNLVTLSDEEQFHDKHMVDYCAGDISTAEAQQLISFLQHNLGDTRFCFYSGVSYRHCLIETGGQLDAESFTPPHDISGQCVGRFLPKNPYLDLMKQSYALLKDHPINQHRVALGKRPANSIWLWGQGTKPMLDSFEDKFGVKGAVISAVDLLKGIGTGASMHIAEVEGATGYLDTNFEGKTHAALDALQNGCDFVYIHLEAPDECGHRNEMEGKVRAIEEIDRRVVGPLIEALDKMGDFRVLICPDHPTPISTMTHASDAVPFLIYDSRNLYNGAPVFSEQTAKQAGLILDEGHTLIEYLLKTI